MSARTEVLSQQASVERTELFATLDALERELGAVTDWRGYVRREPVMTLGIAALGGAILGAATAPRRNNRIPHRSSALMHASESVVGGTATAALLRRAGAFVLDLVLTRALEAYQGTRDASVTTAAAQGRSHPAQASRR